VTSNVEIRQSNQTSHSGNDLAHRRGRREVLVVSAHSDRPHHARTSDLGAGHGAWRATEDGFVTQDNLDWYRRFAAGRPAALVVEATGVRDIASGPLLRIGDDRFLPGLKNWLR
jgi:hypothetical protein